MPLHVDEVALRVVGGRAMMNDELMMSFQHRRDVWNSCFPLSSVV